jgi:hypothetical protein
MTSSLKEKFRETDKIIRQYINPGNFWELGFSLLHLGHLFATFSPKSQRKRISGKKEGVNCRIA